MIDAAAVHHHPDTVRRFRADRPELDLHLTVAPSGVLLDALTRGELDLVVCVAPAEPAPGLVTTPLFDEPLWVYAPRSPGPADTWGPWVAFPSGSHTREVVARAVRAAGAPFDVVAESHQPEVLREMVLLGLGWTVLPPAQAEAGGRAPVRVGTRPLATRRLVAARRADALPNPAAAALLELLLATHGQPGPDLVDSGPRGGVT
jgi:DNA-binding transcriptional LysR family regulator